MMRIPLPERSFRTPVARYALGFAVVLLAGALWTASAYRQRTVDRAVANLETVDMFSFGGVGIVGTPSLGEQSYKTVMAQPRQRALRSFERIYARGSREAKAYALVGLHRLNPVEAVQLERSLAFSEEQITLQEGCLRSRVRLTDVASAIIAGENFPYDWLRSPSIPIFPDDVLLQEVSSNRHEGRRHN
jgi:hypothetical protein